MLGESIISEVPQYKMNTEYCYASNVCSYIFIDSFYCFRVQNDNDADGVGNPCDRRRDHDADGIKDSTDNCLTIVNTDQMNHDGDSYGDACDTDDDNDGVLDTVDNCPLVANPDQLDSNGERIVEGEREGGGGIKGIKFTTCVSDITPTYNRLIISIESR